MNQKAVNVIIDVKEDKEEFFVRFPAETQK